MDINVGGPLGLIILIFDVWAIVSVMQSNADTGAKVVWVVAILLLPILGFIAWFIWGPKGA